MKKTDEYKYCSCKFAGTDTVKQILWCKVHHDQTLSQAITEREREILKHIQIMAEYIGINTEKVIRLRNLIAYLSHLQQKEEH